jgi:hypothetical protein
MEQNEKEAVTGNQASTITGNSETPGFFAVIPASVRYDSSLPQGAKILYAEISSRTNQRGYCWTSNARFVTLYGVNERTINRWVAALHNAGHIIVTYEYYENSKRIKERRIMLPAPMAKVIEKMPDIGPENNAISGVGKNVSTQNMVLTKMSGPGGGKNVRISGPVAENSPEFGKNNAISGVDKNVSTQNMVLTKMSGPGGDKNVADNTKFNNTIAAAAVSTREISPGTIPDTAAAAFCSPEQEKAFKTALETLDGSLVFDAAFYPRALAWLAAQGLPRDFLAWLYKQCVLKKPDSVRGMFRKLFFAPDLAELFKASRKPPPEPARVPCPACGVSHDAGDAECPSCGLERGASEKDVRIRRHLLSLPAEQRSGYEEKVRLIIKGGGGFLEQRQRLDELHREMRFPE